jgi:heat shock protein HslJ
MAARRRRPWLVVVSLAAAGCGPTSVYSRSDTAGLPSTRQGIEEHEWVLDRGDSSLVVDDDNPVTLAVHDDEVAGAAPCNAYRGSFELDDDDTVDITDIALTRRACEPTTMEAEDEVVAALEAVDHARVEDGDDDDDVDDDRLVLENDDGVRLAFAAYDADELLAGTWEVVGITTGDSVDSVAAGTRPTLTFASDGGLVVDTGCRTATSSWELDGDILDLDPLRFPDDGCTRPAPSAQEAALTLALDAADRIDIAPGELLVLDGDDAIVLVATQEGT